MNKPEKLMATAIGSFPHSNADDALNVILKAIPKAPVWPQLPSLSIFEQMEIQYSEGIPRVVIEEDKKRMYFDTTGDYSDDFASFYESYLLAMDPDEGNGDCSSMAISEKYSSGIYALERQLKEKGTKTDFVKVQTTGPCSFALTIVDENKRAIYYNEEFRDIVVKALAMKCRWQIQKFAPYCDKVICFIDEPILSAFGSSTYISVKREDVVAQINEVVEAIHGDNALAGVHCCGNTDWSILIDAGVDIVNFDAFGYGDTIALYPDAVKDFLNNNGTLAWGLIPTSPEIKLKSADDLVKHFDGLVDNLSSNAGIGKDQILSQSIITPSCGTGSMDVADAEAVFAMLAQVSNALQEKF